jgi:hypothetical protein
MFGHCPLSVPDGTKSAHHHVGYFSKIGRTWLFSLLITETDPPTKGCLLVGARLVSLVCAASKASKLHHGGWLVSSMLVVAMMSDAPIISLCSLPQTSIVGALPQTSIVGGLPESNLAKMHLHIFWTIIASISWATSCLDGLSSLLCFEW